MNADLILAAAASKMGGSKDIVDPSLRPTKLFLGGLTRNTTTKQLRDHFSAYGRVLDCVAMRLPDGRPRGFGYVTLDSPVAADRCLAKPQVVDGRVLDMKRAVPEGVVSATPASRLHVPTHKPAATPPSMGSWPEMGPFGFPFPLSPMGLQQPAACDWHWAAENFMPPVAGFSPGLTPDCLEILSRSPPAPESTPLLPEVQLACELLKAQSLRSLAAWAAVAAAQADTASLSASAPEFVPASAKTAKASRPALGEITNTIKARESATKAKKPASDTISFGGELHEKPRTTIGSGLVICIDEELEEINNKPQALDPSLPSIGSADHAAGTCKRCNFFSKGRCQNGKNCSFCHLSHEKRKPSRQEKRERRAAWLAQSGNQVAEMPQELQDDDEDEEDDESEEDQHILQGDKLGMASGLNYFYVAPPPGLSLEPLHVQQAWQPDEEVSPLRSVAQASALLATVPMRPCAATPTSSAAKTSAMVTIGTQTELKEVSA